MNVNEPVELKPRPLADTIDIAAKDETSVMGHYAVTIHDPDRDRDKELLIKALNDVFLEQKLMLNDSTSNLSVFLLLIDEVRKKLPQIHPMEVAREVYVKMHPSRFKSEVADGFVMGYLCASNVRHLATEFSKEQEKANADFLTHQHTVYDQMAKSLHEQSVKLST